MEKYNFVGKNLTPEIKEGFSEKLDQKRQKGLETSFENEVTKTPEDLEIIKKVEISLNEELKELNLPADVVLDPKEVHFLKEGFLVNKGHYDPKDQQIKFYAEENSVRIIIKKIIRKSTSLRDYSFSIILHETIHKHSPQKHEIINRDTPEIRTLGTGYGSYSKKRKENIFKGFNEAVVQRIVVDITQKINNNNLDEVYKTFRTYERQINVVDLIAEKIAKMKKETKEEVWKRFKRGEFTGEMMHLRDVEEAFGPHSLEILAVMGGGEISKSFLEYFITEDLSQREKIGKKIISRKKFKLFLKG